MKSRLTEDAAMPMTVVNPPPVQEMNSGREDQASTTSTSEKNEERDGVNLEMQAL